MNTRFAGLLSGASLIVIAQVSGAYAQSTPASSSSGDDIETVVVTGTLIHNVIPAGAQPIVLDSSAIQATGATSTDQLLATIPQLSSFGSLQTVDSGGTQLTVNRTNLRGLPQGVGGSSPTLVLLDGHRMVSEGIQQAYPDPDVIPSALIDRVEILPDGGSATYGSDAVGGVINFITKKDFDGIDISVRQSLGDDYAGTDVNFTAGTSWDTGSAYIGYNFSIHDALYGRDRDYIKQINYATGLPTGLKCSPGNAVVNGSTYAVNGGNSLALSNDNLCDLSKEKVFYPEENRNALMAGFRQALTNSIEFSVKGYYAQRNDTTNNGPLQGNGAEAPGNPNYISTTDGNAGMAQTVNFDFAPVGGYENVKTKLWSYGVTPMLTWDIGGDWEAVAFYNYGQSQTTANDPAVNTALLATDVASGLINPYNIAASNAGALSSVLDFTGHGIGKDTLSNARLTADGSLFDLPGGTVKVAFGGEYIDESFRGNILSSVTYESVPSAPLNSASRQVEAGFAELNLPVVGPNMDIPLVNSLTIAASERYDHYSDFGSNWAPNVGVTLKPVDWISLRGRWNRSFQAPSLVQLANAATPQAFEYSPAIIGSVTALQNPAVPYNGGPAVAIMGTDSPLKPETAKDYNLGFDISPPFLEGLTLHATYWNIVYQGSIGSPPLGYGTFYGVPSFVPLIQMLPTPAAVGSFLAARGVTASNITSVLAQVQGDGNNPYFVVDDRQKNLGITRTDGFDFGFDYSHAVSFGTIYGNFNGTYIARAITASAGLGTPFSIDASDTDGTSPLTFAATAGATVGDNIRAQVTWNHRAGFKLVNNLGYNQNWVDGFDTFDLFTSYDLKRQNLPPLTFSLGVTNMFDSNPPLYRGISAAQTAGYWNGSTLGRVFQLGVEAKF